MTPVPVIVRDICRLRTHGGHFGFGHTGGIDKCEPYQIMVLEHQNTAIRSTWTYDVRVWCALRAVPHWMVTSEMYRSLSKARARARRNWMIWGWRGLGNKVSSDPLFVDPRCGEALDPQGVPPWNLVGPNAETDPAWFNVTKGDNIATLLLEKQGVGWR